MTGIVCACASEICAVMGCQRVAEIRRQAMQPPVDSAPFYPSRKVGAGDGSTHIPRYLTEEEVRRIVRDEMAKASKS